MWNAAWLNYDDLDLDASYGHTADVDRGETVYRIKAVVALLGETEPGGELDDFERQLPAEFDDLFEFVDAETPPWADDG